MAIKDAISEFVNRFSRAETTILASSLAFYSALSLAPLLILFIIISAQLSLSLQQTFLTQVDLIAGPDAAKTVQLIVDNAKERPDLATLSGLAGVITLLFSASLIFGEMKTAFNKIFECKPKRPEGGSMVHKVWFLVHTRIVQIGLALSCIFLLIASLLASSVISMVFPPEQPFWRIVNLLSSFVFYIGLFSLIFRYMPDDRIAWKNAFKGGLITALLFVVGKELIALYLGHSAIGSPYGVAGSVIILLVWIYYSALITFIGAHVSSMIAASKPDYRRSLVKGHTVPAR